VTLLSRARPSHAWIFTAACALAYVLLAPPSADLAAADYRSQLFSHEGLTLWDNAWYGGHHLLAYSLLAPALSALLGAQLLAAISMTLAAAFFARLIAPSFEQKASALAAGWFALGAAIGLLANRVPFDLGLALGLASLVAWGRARRGGARSLLALALALGVLCACASPVAGAFLALAAIADVLARRHGMRSFGLALAAASLAPIAVLFVAFPEGGSQPFVASAFYPALAGVLAIGALIPASERTLRLGTLLYALVLIGAYVVPSAVGGNADRLGALLAGPVAACALAGSRRGARRAALVVLAPFLLYWQANAAVADFAAGVSDPAARSSYYAPLLGELKALGVGFAARPARIEVVPTRNHFEARFIAPQVMLARGWERQLDRARNALFYDESRPLTPARYRAWLYSRGVSYVALPEGASLDYSGRDEARLVRRAAGAAGLREVWHARHWRLFSVLAASPLATPPALLEHAGHDDFTLAVPGPGTFAVRLRFTPYWALAGGRGCVGRAPGGWTAVTARARGRLHVVIDFSLARIFERGPRCR
jgi:hypothetical protein